MRLNEPLIDGTVRHHARDMNHGWWGGWNGAHMFDLPIKDIAGLMLRVDVG